ncbi:hypothetical protein BDW71DRAFT_204022 [Aspergillus fruticulosus]
MVADSLDDIFGSSPPRPEHPVPQAHSNPTVEPSELPSLRRQHVTAGYRDGISASKAEHVQHGFDAGFPVGAQLGMRAGTILGILEGILNGYGSSSAAVKKPSQKSTSSTTTTKEADEAKKLKRESILRLYKQAMKELNVQAVFAGVDGGALQGQVSEQKPETQLLGKGDKVLSEWESKIPVAAWEEHVMDVLEAKSDDGNGEANEDKDGREGLKA